MSDGHGLGRREPLFFDHVTRQPFRALGVDTALTVEHRCDLPSQYRLWYDQGREGACVGFACSWMMSIRNRRKYYAPRLYREAQLRDEWQETPPEEGTSVKAACDVLMNMGHWRFLRGFERLASLSDGIAAVRWAVNVDEIRTALSRDIPVVIGVNWYSNFDSPQWEGAKVGGGWWIGRGGIGRKRGGHAVCIYAASDAKSAVKIVNSWGADYPTVWMPYDVLERLLRENGEAALITDR